MYLAQLYICGTGLKPLVTNALLDQFMDPNFTGTRVPRLQRLVQNAGSKGNGPGDFGSVLMEICSRVFCSTVFIERNASR